MVIGHLHPVAHNRVGNGNGGMADGRITHPRQIGADGLDNAVVIVGRQHISMLQHLRCGFEGKAGVGAANVGHQARPVGVDIIHGSGCAQKPADG